MKINKLMAVAALSCIALLAAVSCGEDGPGTDGPDTPTIVGNTILVPNELDAVVKVNVEFSSAWQISNTNAWFTVSPLTGEAGPVEFELMVASENTELTEKVGSFKVITVDNIMPVVYYVIQEPKEGIVVTSPSVSIGKKGGNASITIEGNITYTASTEDSWITIGNVEYADSIVLDDNVTKSRYVASTLNITTTENTDAVRTGEVSITDKNGNTYKVTVAQNGTLATVDYSKDFFRRTFMIKHTADWCGPCFAANDYIHAAQKSRPDRFIYAAFYSQCNSAALSRWKGTLSYYQLTGSNAVPTMVVNNYSRFIGGAATSTLTSMIDEATNNVKSHTAIAGEAIIEDNKITIEVSIASKQSGDYNVSVFLLEDKLMYNQAGASGKYEHNNVTRDEITAMYGDKVTLTANQVTEKTFTADIPSYVENKDNLHVYVVVYRPGTFEGTVSAGNLTYMNFKDMIVDNVIDIPGNGFVGLKYEE